LNSGLAEEQLCCWAEILAGLSQLLPDVAIVVEMDDAIHLAPATDGHVMPDSHRRCLGNYFVSADAVKAFRVCPFRPSVCSPRIEPMGERWNGGHPARE
jgi:hypothetical protein